MAVRLNAGMRLVRLGDARQIIRACESEEILILGIEAFRIDGERLKPEMDLIADYSELASEPWHIACRQAARSAEGYLQGVAGQNDLWMEFTLKERKRA